MSNRDGGTYGLYVMTSNGENQQRIEDYADVQFPYTPQWSPLGDYIAFVRYGNYLLANNYEIFVKGNSFYNVSQNNKNDVYPLWSPNQNEYKIVFVSDRDNNLNVYLWSSSNTIPQCLTDNTKDDNQPSWSPDGSKLVYVSMTDDSPTRGQIFVMNADGSNKTRLVNESTLDCSVPVWQP